MSILYNNEDGKDVWLDRVVGLSFAKYQFIIVTLDDGTEFEINDEDIIEVRE